jgi:hypothetical protein
MLSLDVAKIVHCFAENPPEIGDARRPDSQDANVWDPSLLGDAS